MYMYITVLQIVTVAIVLNYKVELRLYSIQRDIWCMGPYARDDHKLTLCRLQSRPKHMHHGQPYDRVDFIPQLGTKNLASGVLYLVVREHGEHCTVRMVSEIWPKIT
jgi:hypothetical protein